jgi:hypothetical protein
VGLALGKLASHVEYDRGRLRRLMAALLIGHGLRSAADDSFWLRGLFVLQLKLLLNTSVSILV